jgi:hypothetical protein
MTVSKPNVSLLMSSPEPKFKEDEVKQKKKRSGIASLLCCLCPGNEND